MAGPNVIAGRIALGLSGAVKLVKLDARGLEYFGDTTEDFWNSFLAAALVAPVFILYLVIRYIGTDDNGSFPVYLLAQMISYAIAWLIFPLAMLYLAPALKRKDRMVRYLVAGNWVSVLRDTVYLSIIILGITGVFSQGVSNFLAMIALMWVLGLALFVARKALDIPFGTAAGIVVMDLLLGVLVEVLTGR